MVRPIIFFVFVFVLLAIIGFNSRESFTNYLGVGRTTKNNWNPSNCGTQEVKVAELGVGSIEPSPAPASDLPSAPAGFQPKETPKPYNNPVLEPAKYIRILAVKEDIQAFFGFQAQSLESQTGPNIQLPLTRARADLSDLINVQSVMERNPGLPSRINNKQLDDITSNLRYLRSMLNDLKVDNVVEGFIADTLTDKPRASLLELQEFQIKLAVELKRLGASGSTDSLTQGRINTLTTIRNEIDDVIQKIQTGVYKPNSIPILKSDIDKSLPILGNTNKALPNFLKNNSLPPAIASLFPGGLSPKDSEQAAQINNIAKGYMKNIFENSSWDVNFNMKYTKPPPKQFKKSPCSNNRPCSKNRPCPKMSRCSRRSSCRNNNLAYGIPGLERSATATPSRSRSNKCRSRSMPKFKTDSGRTPGLPGVSNRIHPEPVTVGLNWEKRSKQIVKQIKKRGLNPKQFGAMPNNVEVDENFSWRGYTKMMCTRLNATTDPGLAVTVGCPEEDWEGWRV